MPWSPQVFPNCQSTRRFVAFMAMLECLSTVLKFERHCATVKFLLRTVIIFPCIKHELIFPFWNMNLCTTKVTKIALFWFDPVWQRLLPSYYRYNLIILKIQLFDKYYGKYSYARLQIFYNLTQYRLWDRWLKSYAKINQRLLLEPIFEHFTLSFVLSLSLSPLFSSVVTSL